MDQVAPGSELAHHDSPRNNTNTNSSNASSNNELLTLLRNFISQSGDFRSVQPPSTAAIVGPNAFAAAAVNIVDPGDLVEPEPESEPQLDSIHPNNHHINHHHHHPQASSSSSNLTDSDPDSQATQAQQREELNEEDLERYSEEIDQHFIQSVTNAEEQSIFLREELIRPNNICKTINDINNNNSSIINTAQQQKLQQQQDQREMPQQNTLLETALTMSNITSSASGSVAAPGGDYVIPGSVGIQHQQQHQQQTQGNFQMQTWGLENLGSVQCDNSPYMGGVGVGVGAVGGRQPFPSDGLGSGFTNPGMDDGYLQGPYAGQSQFNMQSHEQQQQQQQQQQTMLGGQLLHGSQYAMQEYQTAISMPPSRANDIVTPSHVKASQYQQNMAYNTASRSLSHSHNNNNNPTLLTTDSMSSVPYQDFIKAPQLPLPGGEGGQGRRSDSGSEESVGEDRRGEKKLTTTPIPSDAEKTSGSNSSSGSHDDSPSPGIQGPVSSSSSSMMQDASSSGFAQQHMGSDFCHMVNSSLGETFTSNEMLLNEENLINSIPLPDSVVEIDEGCLEYQNAPTHNSSNNGGGSSALAPKVASASKLGGVAGTAATWASSEPKGSVDKQYASVGGDSWSVRKEKRKRRLHKKHKKSKAQHEGDASPTESLNDSEGARDDDRQYRQKHKTHRHSNTSSTAGSEGPQMVADSSGANPSPNYSSMIPKTTADPIGLGKSSSGKSKHGSGSSSSRKDKSERKQEKAKKKQQQHQQQWAAESAAVVSKPNGHHEHKLIAPASLQVPVNKGASYSAKQDGPTHATADSSAVQRWQTVTAIRDPKLPPMLSEMDRIPKRGRPSKKMKEMNLKFKPNGAEVAASAATKAPTPQTEAKPVTSANKVVSMYTINDKGFIEVLNHKPKENRRSRERAEAFRNMLDEISKKTSIQKKTAGAKEVVGAFKQNGVRTRNQASTGPAADESGKKKRSRAAKGGKLFGGAASGETASVSAPSDASKDEDGMYTFSELAKHYKISNSILYRALEQSQRSMNNVRSKPKRGARKKAQKVGSEAKKAIGEFQPRQKEQANKKPEVRSVAEKKVAEPGIAIENSQKPDKPQPLVPIASELQENRPDAVEEPFATSDKSKRKKKKKKHKKERHEEGRKSKKSKEKKKKKKERLHLQQEREKAKSKEEESIHIVPSVVPVSNAAPIAKKKMSSKSASSSSSLESISTGKRPESFSSISGEDEDNAYDGGDSSSDMDPPPASSSSATASSCQLKSVDAMSSPIASPSMLPSVFGSGLTSSQMPSFQGIKEFGGLSQFSEHTRKIEETHDAKSKRHKHKKKKLVRRKNAADPNFLFNMEELSRQLARSCISASLPFLQRSSMGVENAFARNFVVAQNAPAVKAAGIEDSRSYRDPSKNRKAKRAPFPPSGDLQHHRQRFSSKQLNRVSIFCRSEFFVEHGYVQPYSGDSPLGLLKGFYPPKSSATAKQTTVPTEPQLKIDAPSNAKNSTKLTQESDKTKPGLAAREQQQLRHLSESDSDLASNSSRKASRKRGWPLGKPRGPRAKKPSLDETPPAPAPPTRLPGDAREKRTTQSAGQVGFVTGVKPTSATVTANSSNSHDKLNMNEGSPSTDQAGDKAQVSEDLVNHIKAAITARLDSAQVRTDILAKTVDSAVAEYLKKVSGESRPLDKKPRGRPPKNSKATQDVATPSSVSSSTSPAASEKPKKFWASKHRDGAAVRVGVVKKRGPGRPRKSNGLKTAQGAASLAPISRRANASIAPSAIRPNVAAAITKRKLLAKSSKLVVKSLASAKKRNAAVRKPAEPASSHITVNRAKAAVGSLLVGKSLRQQSGSAAWLAATNVPEPGMYHGRAADRHMDEAIESTVRKSSSLSTQSSSDRFHPESPTKAGVAVVKKSLESVVARLKRKQSSVDGEPDAESERNENHNNNVQRSSGGHRRGRGESHKDFYSSDAVPRKKMRVGSEEDLSDVFYPNSSCDLLGRPIAERHVLPEERKAFLTVGLFSAAFKMGSDDVMDAEDESSSSSPLLPPPSHAGLFLRKATRDFQLPYDIWWMYNQKRIHARQDPATRFVKIDANVYVDTQPSSDQEEHICVCKTLSDIHHSSSSSSQVEGCGKECLNRLMYIECSPETCPCGKMCGNRSIQNKQWCSELERFRTADRGWGVKTNGQISEGDFILEYVGEVVSDREFRRRTIENYNAHSDHYCIQLEAGKVIDGYRMANEGRFVNHSCQPNCEMQKWVVKGEYRIGLFAKKLIAPGEELTYDYNFHAYNLDRQQLCRCGAKECRGVIGGKTQKVYSEGHLHSARAGKAGIRGADAGRVKTSKAPLHNDSEEFCGNNIQRIDSQQIPLLSNEERRFVRAHRLFLHRNLRQMAPLVKLRQLREGDKPLPMQGVENDRTSSDKDALLESAITDVFTAVMTCKDENGISVAIPFINLPSKLQNPEYYQHVTDPVDLNFVEQKLVTKQYKKFDEFCSDVSRVFRSAEKYHGRKSTLGRDVARLRKAFTAARNTAAARLGDVTDKSKKKHLEAQRAELAERRRNSDFIRCICGIYKDEGVMIQCEKCYVWQHCDCMSVLPADYNDQRAYLCDECDEREVPVEVPVVPQPPSAPPGHTYYLTLTKDDLVIKQGDCVRLIHDHCLRQRSSSNPPVRTSYRLQSHSTVDALDFFRIKKLWTDDNGDKFAYGHHFLRPQDVRHDDSHLFFPNELIATPLHEIVPLEAVVSTCCVMDVDTFCMGRPKGVKEADVYICEQRCGNALKVVGDITKSRYPIYTKSHVFDEFPVRLAPPVRDYQVPDQMRRTQARRTQWLKATQHGVKTNNEPGGSGADEEEERDVAMETDADKRGGAEHSLEQESVKGGTESDAEDEEAVEGGIADSDDMDSDSGHPRNVKQKRLNGILSKLIKDASSRHLQVNQDA